MLVHWSPNLSVGVETLDNDHRSLIDSLNRLDSAIADGRVDEEEGLLDGLIERTEEHFEHEEAIMVQADYPELDHHRSVHRALIAEIREFRKEFDEGKVIGPETTAFIKDWLLKHILESDKALGGYLQGRDAA